jgi:GTP-binding protein EngB required for normal cell division
MHEHLRQVLEKSELAIGAAQGLVSPDDLVDLSRIVDFARARLDYPDEVLVVALAGGTGSGKSSLFNSLTGTEAAPVGVVRPTTSEPLVGVPSRWLAAFTGHLDRLGIDRRIEVESLGHCLIDLPDTDSVVVDHRHRVEELIPLLDVVVWVVDPEKYRDAALHDRYLRPLAGYASQFVFALNQADRIDPESLAEVTADLARALTDEGVEPSLVLTMAASPAVGPPMGIDALRDHLDRQSRATLFHKLLVDLSTAAQRLSGSIGPVIDYRARAAQATEEAVGHLVQGETIAASEVLTALLDALTGEIGGPARERVAEVAALLPSEVDVVARSLPQPDRATWWQRLRRVTPPEPDRSAPAREGVTRLLEPVDDLMASRARALALTTDLTVTVVKALSKLSPDSAS